MSMKYALCATIAVLLSGSLAVAREPSLTLLSDSIVDADALLYDNKGSWGRAINNLHVLEFTAAVTAP